MARIKMINGTAHFYCIPCRSLHRVDARFVFNYDMNLPTFRPDIRFSIGPYPEGHALAGQVFQCHSRIVQGSIMYLSSSTHDQAGKTLDLPDFDELAAVHRAQEEARKSLAALRVD